MGHNTDIGQFASIQGYDMVQNWQLDANKRIPMHVDSTDDAHMELVSQGKSDCFADQNFYR